MGGDAEFLGLRSADAPGRFSFVVEGRLARLDGRLYGGTAIAVSINAAELLSGRPALWMTTQFVSTVGQGSTVEVLAEVLAAGRRTNQLRVTGTSADGEVVFASLGATGLHRPDGLSGEFERRPEVTPPEESEPWATPFAGIAKAFGIEDLPEPPRRNGFGLAVEMRGSTPTGTSVPAEPGRLCIWVRRRDGLPMTAAIAAYLADVVPLGVANALGVAAAGTSLDNTIRVASFPPDGVGEWILLDLRPHFAAGGYGHGSAHVWAEDGRLLATASQTASMTVFDLAQLAQLRGADGDS